jgi:formamidopyrimidine-DNA glycosylase
MPELPDLEAYRSFFNSRLPGVAIEAVTVRIPIVIRVPKDDFIAALTGNVFGEVERRGKYMLFSLRSGDYLAIHPMLTGRFQYRRPQERRQPKTCFVLALSNGHELRYFDERRMGKVYLVKQSDLHTLPLFADLGPEPLSDQFTEEAFREHLRHFRGQMKSVIRNDSLVAAIGNAYADEILFAAGIHPYRKRVELPSEAEGRLYQAIRSVLGEATAIVTERVEKEGLPVDEYRDHLKVHRRGGQPCPQCGSPISEITSNQRITSFCRHCQK